MDAAKKAQLRAHARAIAELLYEETDREQVKTLLGIEEVVREQLLEYVSPEIGSFLSKQAALQSGVVSDASKASSES